MVDGSPLQEGVSCEDKVEIDDMTEEEYENICKYIPGNKESQFPLEVLQYLAQEEETTDIQEKIDRPAPGFVPAVVWSANGKKNINIQTSNINERSSAKCPDTMAWWQDKDDVQAVGWDQQRRDPVLVAISLKCTVPPWLRRL